MKNVSARANVPALFPPRRFNLLAAPPPPARAPYPYPPPPPSLILNTHPLQAAASAAPPARAAAGAAASPASAAAPPPHASLDDASVLALLHSGALSPHALESSLGDPLRAVKLRRMFVAAALAPATGRAPPAAAPLSGIPYRDVDAAAFYKTVLNTNCESVIGFLPYPLGVVGPLPVDGEDFRVPFATTEGALVASTNRGASALRRAGGVATVVGADGMTRAPLVKMPSVAAAAALRAWVAAPENFARLRDVFNGTSRFGRLQSLDVTLAGRNAYLRFKCSTGDAMGMNMITKGVSECLGELRCVAGRTLLLACCALHPALRH
jgi:hydroxymethylglutaryl-CoA reductase (NADPH)